LCISEFARPYHNTDLVEYDERCVQAATSWKVQAPTE
jgi:hypothetical protein